MTNNPEFPLDQTTFSGEQPFYQNPELTAAQMENLAKPPDKKPWFKKKKVIVAIPLLFIFLIVALIVLMPKKPNQEKEPEPTPPPVENQDPNYMVERIRRLQKELKQADPTKTDVLFPPVDMAIELDPKER